MVEHRMHQVLRVILMFYIVSTCSARWPETIVMAIVSLCGGIWLILYCKMLRVRMMV